APSATAVTAAARGKIGDFGTAGRYQRWSGRTLSSRKNGRPMKGEVRGRSGEMLGGCPGHWAGLPLVGRAHALEPPQGLPHVYQILLGTPEAAEATEQIGKFLRARVR